MQKGLLLALFAACSSGCWEMGKGGDAKVPGDALGTYRVEAELDSSTCGEGALGSTEHWRFDVKLSRQGSDLYWLNGKEAISGQVNADGSFAFDTRVKVPVSPKERGNAGCSVLRTDSALGKLAQEGAEVSGFSGTLQFSYTPDIASDCSALLGVSGGFAALPCQMDYLLTAERVAGGQTSSGP